MRRNKKTFRDNYSVPGCRSCEQSPENYNFLLRNCTKISGRNVPGKVHGIVEGSQQQAAALVNGDWVLCYSGRGEEEKVWLGRCVNNDADKRFCKGVTWKNGTNKTQKNIGAGQIKLEKNEIGVTVQWYDKCGFQANPAKSVQYKICTTVPPCVQSGTSIISSKFAVTQMEGAQARTAYTRRQADSTPGTQFLRKALKRNKYMTTKAASLTRQAKETWELDIGTYSSGVNAVDWFNSR
jgi:hypothetical protein